MKELPVDDDLRWMKRCPRFDRCSSNQCPLDPLIEQRPCRTDDPRRTCLESLRTRLAVVAEAHAAGVEIAVNGLTVAEAKSGKPLDVLLAEWDAKTERLRNQGARLFVSRRSARGREEVATRNC
jgi:hypothetical protein